MVHGLLMGRWSNFDPFATGYMPLCMLKRFVAELDKPLGFDPMREKTQWRELYLQCIALHEEQADPGARIDIIKTVGKSESCMVSKLPAEKRLPSNAVLVLEMLVVVLKEATKRCHRQQFDELIELDQAQCFICARSITGNLETMHDSDLPTVLIISMRARCPTCSRTGRSSSPSHQTQAPRVPGTL